VLVTALSPKPENRYQDSVAFADALRQVAHRHGLLSSAPQLAEHLRYILGGDPDRWLTDEKPTASGDPSTQKIPAKELEGKEAASIGVVEAANLYVVSGNDVVSPDSVGPKKLKSDPRGKLPPAATAPVDVMIPIDEEDNENEAPTRVRNVGPDVTPPPPPPIPPGFPVPRPSRRPTIPPPPPVAALTPPPPPLPESPFDIPPTPGPVFDEFPPTPPPLHAPVPGLPPGLPRPGGYLAPPGFNPSLRIPAAPAGPRPVPALFDPAGGFDAGGGFNLAPPETIDFSASAAPVVTRPGGPPGLLVLIVLLGAAVGGAKLGQVVTRADLATLDAATEAETKAAAPVIAPLVPEHR
jgi:hypothetical protein